MMNTTELIWSIGLLVAGCIICCIIAGGPEGIYYQFMAFTFLLFHFW